MSSSNLPLVQWSFLQYKKTGNSSGANSAPIPSFLHSATQIGSKLLIFGGCDYFGKPQSQLLMYDTVNFAWSTPNSDSTGGSVRGGGAYAGDDSLESPGARYGHTATLIEMHPPKILVYGGIVLGGTFEFDQPDTMEENANSLPGGNRSFMSWRRKGKANNDIEETDESVYYLSLRADKWEWNKPLIHNNKDINNHPIARCEHTTVKTSTNEVIVFGGWNCADLQPLNDLWAFNVVDNEWTRVLAQGILPKARFRHTAEVLRDKMFILGGSDSIEDVCDGSKGLGISVLSLDSYRWSHPELRGVDPFPRSGHSTAVVGAHSIAVFGGKRNNEVFLNDLILIDTRSYSTTVVNTHMQHLPTPVANSSLSCVGNKLFVFGGTDVKGNCFNDIRSLDVGPYLDEHDISVGEGAASDYSFKILIIGDSTVGKSALLTRFSENIFLSNYTSTIGIDFNSRMIRVEGSICKLEIWDTAGQERFSTITANYYRGAQGALLVYDVTQKHTFTHVKNWFERAKQLGGQDIEAVLVGNKVDLEAERKVPYSEGDTLASELNVPFVETSALTGDNVEQAFVCMTANIKRSLDRRGLSGVKTNPLQKAGGVQLARGEKKSGMLSAMCGCV